MTTSSRESSELALLQGVAGRYLHSLLTSRPEEADQVACWPAPLPAAVALQVLPSSGAAGWQCPTAAQLEQPELLQPDADPHGCSTGQPATLGTTAGATAACPRCGYLHTRDKQRYQSAVCRLIDQPHCLAWPTRYSSRQLCSSSKLHIHCKHPLTHSGANTTQLTERLHLLLPAALCAAAPEACAASWAQPSPRRYAPWRPEAD